MKPNHYLVKGLQAAVALGGREIEFRLGLHTVKLDFKFAHRGAVEAGPLQEALAGKPVGEEAGTGHLTQALKEARDLPSPRVQWSIDKEHFLTLEGEQIEIREARLRGGAVRGKLKVWRQAPLEGHRKKVIRALEHRTLYGRARYSPTPVTLDGREIERGWPRGVQPEGDWFDYLSYPYYLMEGYLKGPQELPTLEFPSVSLHGFTAEQEGFYSNAEIDEREQSLHFKESLPVPSTGALPQPTLFKYFEGVASSPTRMLHEVECQAAFALPLKLEGPGRVAFVVDGVTRAEEPVDLGIPGLFCVASGQGLQFHRDEFRVASDAAYLERVSGLKTLASSFGRALAPRIGRFKVLASDGLAKGAVGSVIYAEEVRRGLSGRLKL